MKLSERLESGEETPTLKTLARVSLATGLRFHVDVADGTATLAAAEAWPRDVAAQHPAHRGGRQRW